MPLHAKSRLEATLKMSFGPVHDGDMARAGVIAKISANKNIFLFGYGVFRLGA